MRRPPKFWHDPTNIRRELDTIIAKIGHFPNYTELQRLGHGTLAQAINNLPGKFSGMRELYGAAGAKPPGYWSNPQHIEQEVELLIEQLGYLPSKSELRSLGCSTLAERIGKHRDLINSIRIRHGLKKGKKPDNSWKNFENVTNALSAIVERTGHFPTKTELEAEGEYWLIKGIQAHGGFHEVGKKFDASIRKPPGYWENPENVKKELEKVIETQGHFPTKDELDLLGHSTLAARMCAIGFSSLRKEYDAEGYKPRRYWQDFDNVRKEVETAMDLLGHFPSQKDLRELGCTSVARAISKYHGGFKKVREMMGQKTNTPRGILMDFDYVAEEVLELMHNNGFEELPSDSVLRALGRGTLGVAISRYHGGFERFRTEIDNYLGRASERENLEHLLLSYVGTKRTRL